MTEPTYWCQQIVFTSYIVEVDAAAAVMIWIKLQNNRLSPSRRSVLAAREMIKKKHDYILLTLWSFISDSEWNSSRIKTIKHMKSLILLPSQFLSDHSINRLHTRCVWTLSSMTTSTEWCISSRHEMCKQMSIQLKTLIVSCQLLFILFL